MRCARVDLGDDNERPGKAIQPTNQRLSCSPTAVAVVRVIRVNKFSNIELFEKKYVADFGKMCILVEMCLVSYEC